jgi:hypothetical protein
MIINQIILTFNYKDGRISQTNKQTGGLHWFTPPHLFIATVTYRRVDES